MSEAHMTLSNDRPIVLFSGQGSQKVGMGNDLDSSEVTRGVLECASDIFGFDVAQLLADGPQEKLDETLFAQPAIVTLSLALYRLMEERGSLPAACLGFSLGQVSALYASGMLDLEQTFRFAKRRSEIMSEAALSTKGAMCALLGADEESVEALCEECADGEVLVPANFNCPGQIVISGTVDAIARAKATWESEKKRAMMLATSGAFHSPLMADAAQELKAYLDNVEFASPKIPLICNVDARPLAASEAAEHLSAHLISPVRFMQSVQMLEGAGAERFVEVGVGGVLIGLVKRINKSTERTLIQSVEDEKLFAENER